MVSSLNSSPQAATDPLWKEIFAARSVINTLLNSKDTIQVLEVGCGDRTYIRTEKPAYRVGIDISEQQLERNTTLNEKILGDIQTYQFPSSCFDLIVFWWVLEHLPDPQMALQNCQKALTPEGIIVIASPNLFSVKGLLTKITPHGFHNWVYRAIYKYESVEVGDHPPFKTFLKWSIAPAALQTFAANHNFTIVHFAMFEDPKQWQARQTHRVTGLVWHAIKLVTKIVSLGTLDAELTDFILVLQKNREVVS